jgi:2-polyprenyl-3-methyl-5-hydroxy-6-metoxy-1,4-benzoquinol methylase
MTERVPAVRQGEYAARGDYHRALDPDWNFLPTYLAKLSHVRRYLDALPPASRVLDAGCGEGVLVEEYRGRLAIEGIDPNYESPLVRRGSLLSLPHAAGSFDCVLCLDVLEHLPYADQPVALGELARVLRPDGEALVSVPNLAHLQSRVHFLLAGRLIRTAAEAKHPGDRPAAEYMRLFARAGLLVADRQGIFPTVPVLTAWIRRAPARRRWLHTLLGAVLPVPGWCFLNLFRLRKAHNSSPTS